MKAYFLPPKKILHFFAKKFANIEPYNNQHVTGLFWGTFFLKCLIPYTLRFFDNIT